ncbi:PH domain leucine-rich repeat-containing protein phosphatase 1-like [Neosynchiropus ocellatus]
MDPGREREPGEDGAALFGRAPAGASLLQIAIRNGIYQNQAAHAASPARRRPRHRRNLSLGAAPTCAPCGPASPLSTLSLDRKTFLRQKQSKRLQASDRSWVRADLRRGCIHVHDWLTPSHPRPVLLTADACAGEVACRLEGSEAGAVLRICQVLLDPGAGEERCPRGPSSNSSSEVCLSDLGVNSGSDLESSTCEDFTEHRDSLGEGPGLGSDSSAALSPSCDSANEGPDPFESSSDEADLISDPPDAVPEADEPASKRPLTDQAPVPSDPGPPGGSRGWAEPTPASPTPALFIQLHGGPVRRLGSEERPLQILTDYLTDLGYQDPWRVQEEAMNPEIGCLIRFYFGKPRSVGGTVQLSGVFNVRKGKLALPVNRWSKRQVTLSGTCLIVSSVKHTHTGKMHILPMIGGKVEEVRRHSHCLALTSAGPQSRTYYVSFDSYTEHLRWLRAASKVSSQRVSSVDLSCCSLEELPTQLFYSQDLTHLNLKNNFLSPHRGVPALSRFCKLRSLSLASNGLLRFPRALCDLATLTELDLSGNSLESVPAEVGLLTSLQTLLLDGNQLRALPAELAALDALAQLGLTFNKFPAVPAVLEKLRGLERLSLAGNLVSTLDLAGLQWLAARHVDLRLNRLRAVTLGDPDQLVHVAQLDLRDAGLRQLDLRALTRLELLRCDRNSLSVLRVASRALTSLHAAHNELQQLEVQDPPESLALLDLSWNQLSSVPDWVGASSRLEVLDLSHNRVSELPARLWSGGGLKKLLAGWNQLRALGDGPGPSPLEVLDLQRNQLKELPQSLFLRAQSLRLLNVSANRLESLPAPGPSEESGLEELYLTSNLLTDRCVPLLGGHGQLRVLHLAFNQLQSFTASKLAQLDQLEQLDLSGNRLRAVPTTLLSCRRLHTLWAHSNCIDAFPEVLQLPEIKCVDLSCNELREVSLPESLPPKLLELDLTGNPRLTLDHKSLELLNNIRCFRVDPCPTGPGAAESHGAPAVWSHGFTEASGPKNKLCVAALALDSFGGSRECLYGVFDGERNVEVPYLLQCTMGDVLAEELQRGPRRGDYMSDTFLTMQSKLGTAGQRLGGGAALCHVSHDPVAPGEPGGCFTLTAANVGRCRAVLCRAGAALELSKVYTVGDEDELRRVRRHNAVVAEDNKVGGATDATRIMGFSFLCPSISPRPHVSSVTLTPRDEFFLVGSRGLWDALSPGEAVDAVRSVPDALAAAKKLVTLAQSSGCADSLSAVVVQLSITEDCCCFCEPPPPPPSPGPGSGSLHFLAGEGVPLPPALSGTASEPSSEFSASEMSSEVGSTASSEDPPPHVEPLPSQLGPGARGSAKRAAGGGGFQRQFSGALSDNGLDSEDEEPIAGVFSNGSRVEVEADIHCRGHAPPPRGASPLPLASATLSGESRSGSLGRCARANGSVACPGRGQDVIEEAADAPARRRGGYFNAPAQPDPDDQLIIPPELEEEVRQMIQQQQQEIQNQQSHSFTNPADFFVTPL